MGGGTRFPGGSLGSVWVGALSLGHQVHQHSLLGSKGPEPPALGVSLIKLVEFPICKIELLRGPIEVKLAGAQYTAWSPLSFL